jgi:HEAT repeat protein
MEYDDNNDVEEFPIAYSIDNLILMHRDAHFGGNFDIMLDYYKKNGRGTSIEFDVEKIQDIADMQHSEGKDLSPLMLSGAEAERVAQSRRLYKNLRAICEADSKKNIVPKLIAELILAENEELEQAVNAVVAEKTAIVPALIDLLRSEDFHDQLAPGYGQAPTLAAECLGKIGDKRAIISLFESIGMEDFFNEDIVFIALKAIGEPAKNFLLKVLHARPITGDNERAAVALIIFKDDSEVSCACLKMLQEIDINKNITLATYLVLACEGLANIHDQKELLALSKKPTTPKNISLDILAISKSWTLKT